MSLTSIPLAAKSVATNILICPSRNCSIIRSRIPCVRLPCKAPEEKRLIAKFLASLLTAALVLQKIIPRSPSLEFKKCIKNSSFSIGSTTIY